MENPIVHSYVQTIRVSIPTLEADKARGLINKKLIGKATCNKLVDGKYVSDIEDPELEAKLVNIHYELDRGFGFKLVVNIHLDGTKSYSLA